MKAITQDRYGSADVLRLRDIERPTPSEREVLVRVQAAGIARGVLHVMTGEPYLMRLVGFGLLKPKNPVPGQDVAGTVTATGAGVTRFKVGDEVFGIAKGSFAEYAVAREDKLSPQAGEPLLRTGSRHAHLRADRPGRVGCGRRDGRVERARRGRVRGCGDLRRADRRRPGRDRHRRSQRLQG